MLTLADELKRALDRLVAPRTHRLHRDGGHVERVTLPSLLDLLSTAVASSRSSGKGDAGGAKSKPPIDVSLVDLLTEIDGTTFDACREYGLTVRYRYRDELHTFREEWSGVPFPARLVPVARAVTDARDVAGNLRQLVPWVVAFGGLDLSAWWLVTLGRWAARASAAVGDREDGGAVVPLPMSCPDCATERVERIEDGETYRDRAVVATIRAHALDRVECRACGASWGRGPSLDELVTSTLAVRGIDLAALAEVAS